MRKRNRQSGNRQRLADAFVQFQNQRRDRAGRGCDRIAFKQVGVEKPRQQCGLTGADLTESRRGLQRQSGGIPIARARQTEDAGGQGGRQSGRDLQRGTGGVLTAGQQGDIKTAAEQFGRGRRARRVQQRPRLIQRSDRQQPIDARQQKPPVRSGIGRGIGLGQQQRDQQALQGGQAIQRLAVQCRNHRIGASQTPQIARQAGDFDRQNPDRIRRGRPQRGNRHIGWQGTAFDDARLGGFDGKRQCGGGDDGF